MQVNVDWNNAPPSATIAELRITWQNNSKFLISEYIIGFIPRPITPHPHAEIIAKYAEVAARRCDPWVEFEWFDRINDTWVVCGCSMAFDNMKTYRHIGDKSDPMTARKGDDKPWNLNRDD